MNSTVRKRGAGNAGKGRNLDLSALNFFVDKPWILAPGIWLAWFWMAFGYNICTPLNPSDFHIIGVAAALVAATVMFILCSRKWQRATELAQRPLFLFIVGILATIASLLLALNVALQLPHWVCYILCAIAGGCAAIMLTVSLLCFVHLGFRQGFIALHVSILACFFAFFVTLSLPNALRSVFFSGLPLLVTILVRTGLRNLKLSTWRFAGNDEGAKSSARLNWGMLGSFAFLFMTIGYVRSFTLFQSGPSQALSLGAPSAVTILAILATGIIIAECFSFFTTAYLTYYHVFACLVIPFVVVSSALGVTSNYILSILEGTAYLTLCLIVLCAALAAISVYKRHPLDATGKILAVVAGGAAAGWILREIIGLAYPEANASIAFLVAFSFLNVAIFLFGFSPNTLQAYISGGVPEVKESTIPSSAGDSQVSFEEAAERVAADSGLSKREKEIFLLLVSGESSQKIAETLVISYHTVRAHIRNIHAKLEVHSYQEMRDKVNAELEKRKQS